MSRKQSILIGFLVPVALFAQASGPDQTKLGAGNATANALASDSAFVQTSYQFLLRQTNQIQDANIRYHTSDAIRNVSTCVSSRAGVVDSVKDNLLKRLIDEGLAVDSNGSAIVGGAKAGVFPPLVNDGSGCPTLPMRWFAAPGGAYNGHHSYPGGLAIHEAFNSVSSMNFASGYRKVYGSSGGDGIPYAGPEGTTEPDIFISQDLMVAAPIWHDWAKPIVFQWNADGTEFSEYSFGGNGNTDAWGQPGDSRTGAHHIITIAEMMKRGLPPDLIITMASAHSAPTSGSEYKVVNWLRAGAILAQVDAVEVGVLYKDSAGRLRLPQLRQLGAVDLLDGPSSLSHTNVLSEYVLHNLSDADFTLTGPAVTEINRVLAATATQFGFNSSDASNFNNKFRNRVLSYLSAERLLIIYANSGLDGVSAEITKIKAKLN